jgi:hypothetical protein
MKNKKENIEKFEEVCFCSILFAVIKIRDYSFGRKEEYQVDEKNGKIDREIDHSDSLRGFFSALRW